MGNPPLNLNWQHLLNNAAPPPEIEVVVGNSDPSLLNLSDQQIQEKIRRLERTVGGLGETLPDKGVKLRSQICRCQNELERRKLVRAREDAEKSERANQSPTTESSGPVNDIRPWADVKSQQSFTVIFSKKLEERSDSSNGEWRSINREKSENSRKIGKPTRVNRKRIRRTSLPPKMSSKPLPFQSARSLIDKDNDGRVTGPSKSLPSRRCFPDNSFKRGKVSGNNNAVDERSKKVQHFVLLDDDDEEEEPELTVSGDTFEKLKDTRIYYPSRDHPECVELSYADLNCLKPHEYLTSSIMNFYIRKETRIYYPSRDHPECVELSSADLNCLKPHEYLTSSIMNFYIRYLQKPLSPTGQPRGEYIFFNTYFYRKLEEAVSSKADNASFSKLRRWWKGVNIFQKAYIFLPIHGDLHWSLVIICIPAKEDESGPIVLHLDSLGMHSSKTILDDVGLYLTEEWKYINNSGLLPDLPISESIWSNLPPTIEKKTLRVPQQKNDYDCGLFVLYFMERFIEEAPERLKRKDLAMFGSKWFLPEEASGLRKRLRELLIEEFKNASRLEDGTNLDSALSSGSPESDVEQVTEV